MTLDHEKAALRARMGRLRAALPAADRARLAVEVERRLLVLDEIVGARTVLLFYSFGSEVATAGLVRHLQGVARVLLPYLVGDDMEAAEARPGEELLPTTYGPREPGGREPVPPEEVDVAVTPGLAFDAAGRRLGYGGGYYDRYLARMRPGAPRIGIGYGFQVVDRVPAGTHDRRLDLLVTDAAVLRCEGWRGGRRAAGGRD